MSCGLFAAAGSFNEHVVKNENQLVIAISWMALLAFVIPTFILLVNGNLPSPWHAWRELLYLTCIWITFRFLLPSRAHFISSKSWAFIILLCANLFVIYALIQYFDLRFWYADRLFPIWNIYTDRFPGPLAQANFQGLFLLLALLAAFRKVATEKDTVWIFSSILPLTGLFLTAGRMTFILLPLLILVMTFIDSRPKYFLIKICIIMSLSSILFLIISSISNDTTHIQSALDRIESSGLMLRLIIWDMSFRLFLQHPWLGIGLGNMPAHGADGLLLTLQAHPEWKDISSLLSSGHIWAHNTILQFLMELGIIGGIVIASLYYFSIKNLIKVLHKKDLLSEATIHGSIACLIILLHGLVSVSTMQPFFLILLAIYLSASIQNSVSKL